MLSPVRIKNFKSLRTLEFEARRVNLFIGEPNSGKSLRVIYEARNRDRALRTVEG